MRNVDGFSNNALPKQKPLPRDTRQQLFIRSFSPGVQIGDAFSEPSDTSQLIEKANGSKCKFESANNSDSTSIPWSLPVTKPARAYHIVLHLPTVVLALAFYEAVGRFLQCDSRQNFLLRHWPPSSGPQPRVAYSRPFLSKVFNLDVRCVTAFIGC